MDGFREVGAGHFRDVEPSSGAEDDSFFHRFRASVAFVALVAEIGEPNGYVHDIDLRHLEVTLRVATSEGRGLTELDFKAAHLFRQP